MVVEIKYFATTARCGFLPAFTERTAPHGMGITKTYPHRITPKDSATSEPHRGRCYTVKSLAYFQARSKLETHLSS